MSTTICVISLLFLVAVSLYLSWSMGHVMIMERKKGREEEEKFEEGEK